MVGRLAYQGGCCADFGPDRDVIKRAQNNGG
jgi:hypothetical protein